MRLWRISDFVDLDGTGGKLYSGRWHSAGRPVVYLADSSASALLEMLVQLNAKADEIPDLYTLLRIDVGIPVAMEDLNLSSHPNWKTSTPVTKTLGDAWLSSGRTALARVPSSIVAETWNYLFNPQHPDAAKLRIAEVIQDRYDLRLMNGGRAK